MPLFSALMKYERYLNTIFSLIAFGLLGWAALAFPQGILNLGFLTGVLSFLLIVICLTPIGSLCLGSRAEALSLKQWFWQLFQGQLVLLLFTLSTIIAFFWLGPSFAQDKSLLALLQQTIAAKPLWHWSIFPWGIYGISALVLAYIVYVKGGEPFIYQIARNSSPKRFEPMIKTFTDGTTSSLSIMAYSLVASAIVLLFSYSAEILIKVHHFVIPFITLSLLSLFMPWYTLKKSRRLLNKTTRRKASLNQLYILFIIPLVTILIIATFGNKWFLQHYPKYYNQLQCHQCARFLSQAPLADRLASLYLGWWLIWTPLASSFIAFYAKGRTVREFVAGIFLFPVLTAVAFLMLGTDFLMNLLPKIRPAAVPALFFLIASMTWFIFAKINKEKKDTSVFFSGFMPDTSQRRSRVWLRDGSKITGISKIAPRLAMSVIITLFLHTMMGWYGIQLQVAVMGAVFVFLFYGEVIFLAQQFLRDRVWQGNQSIKPFSEHPLQK